MTFDESTTVLAIILANYQTHFKNFSEDNAMAVATTWSIAFADIPFEIVYIAVLRWIAEKEHPPKICQIKQEISRTLYYEAKDALDNHKKNKNLSEKAVAKYESIFEVAQQMRSNKYELTLSKFINDDGNYLLLESTGKERLLE